MAVLYLSNSKGRDAQVMAANLRQPPKVRWIDDEGRQVNNLRIMKASIDRDFEALATQLGGPDKVGEALIHADPEIDLETVGCFLRETSRVYVNPEKKIVHRVQQWEVVRNPDGSERTRRLKKPNVPNVTEDQPIRWSGKLLPKKEVFNKF